MNSGACCILTHCWPSHVTDVLRACPGLCSRDVWRMSLTNLLLCHESQFLHPHAAQQSEVALWAAPYWLVFLDSAMSRRTLDGWVGMGLKDQRIPEWLGWKGPHSPTTPPLCRLTAPH